VGTCVREGKGAVGRKRAGLQGKLQVACRAQMGRTFTMQIRVRYGECDPQGVVFNANHFGYFDVILTEAWREAIGPYGDMLEQGTDLVVAEASAKFLGPARFDDLLDAEWRITRLGTTAMSTRIDIGNNGRP